MSASTMDTNNLKLQLTEQQTALEKRINAIKSDFAAGRSATLSEQAIANENDEVLVQLSNEAEQELADINLALKKIANASYGACEQCGNDIEHARLQAIPYSRCCTQCTA